jgi:hypothetical protein
MNRHAIDAVSLVFGFVFLSVVGVWLLDRLVDLGPIPAGWLAAGGLIVLGVLGLVAVALQDRGGSRRPS